MAEVGFRVPILLWGCLERTCEKNGVQKTTQKSHQLVWSIALPCGGYVFANDSASARKVIALNGVCFSSKGRQCKWRRGYEAGLVSFFHSGQPERFLWMRGNHNTWHNCFSGVNFSRCLRFLAHLIKKLLGRMLLRLQMGIPSMQQRIFASGCSAKITPVLKCQMLLGDGICLIFYFFFFFLDITD